MSSLPKILIVEDDEDLCALLKSVLSTDYEVRVTSSGAEAADWAEEWNPQVAVLDVMMPEQPGWIVCAKLKQILPDLRVIFLTALAERDNKDFGQLMGGDDYMEKPFETQVLIDRIRDQLAHLAEA